MDKLKQAVGIALVTTGVIVAAQRAIGKRSDVMSGLLLALIGVGFMALNFSESIPGVKQLTEVINGKTHPAETIIFLGDFATWRGVIYERDHDAPEAFPFHSLLQSLRAARVKQVAADVTGATPRTLATIDRALAAEGIALRAERRT